MMRRWLPMGALAAALALAPSARAQSPPAAAVSPETAQAQAVEAAEDLALARVLAGLRLNRSQMQRLLPFLESTQKEIRDAEAAARAALAGLQPRLSETRAALIAGQSPSTRAEGQIAEQVRIHTGKIRQLRADRLSSLRRTLTGLLSAEQQTALGETARSLDARDRSARIMARVAAGGRDGDRGPAAGMARMLDRARGASDAEYAQERLEIAARLARMGPRRGAGDREEAVPTDPQAQARLAPVLALIDRTRQMPDAAYQNSRTDLAMQLWAQRAGMGGEADPAETSEAIDELLDRYFFSPRMIGAMRARMEQTK